MRPVTSVRTGVIHHALSLAKQNATATSVSQQQTEALNAELALEMQTYKKKGIGKPPQIFARLDLANRVYIAVIEV